MGGGANPVKRATVKKASIRKSLLFQSGIVGNGRRGNVEGTKRSAGMSGSGSVCVFRLLAKNPSKLPHRFRGRG
jgi:hypothetical protein